MIADDPPADNDDASSCSDAASDVYASNTMDTGVEEREAAVPVEEAAPCTQGEGAASAHSNDSIPRGIDVTSGSGWPAAGETSAGVRDTREARATVRESGLATVQESGLGTGAQ